MPEQHVGISKGTWAKLAPRAVYLHIPFCTNKCFYCDFNSYISEGQPIDAYLDALERELQLTVTQVAPPQIETIFVGGGTPTVLTPKQLERFLASVRKAFPDRSNSIEWTMEANPGTTDRDKLAVMREGGVNRISFGAQSFDAQELERIGRIHRVQDVFDSIDNARAEGFSNMSVDLMFGLPNQTAERFINNVNVAHSLDLPHYSVYHLKIEEHTLFHTLYERGELPLPEEDTESDMFRLLMETMQRAGYRQYEISNFSRPGFESRHNNTYWRNEAYYGIGAGAHGYMHGVRHWNIKGVQGYIDACKAGLPHAETTPVTRYEAMEDFMMVGLRLLDGIYSNVFEMQFGVPVERIFGDVLKRMTDKGLLDRIEFGGKMNYRLSERGIWLGNEVFGAFLGGTEKEG